MWQARFCLLLTALIWGSTFIAQRMIADIINPTGYNAVRFALGALALSPLLFIMKDSTPTAKPKFNIYWASLLLGLFLCMGASLQQFAIAYTTAGKTAFITGLYIVLVPLTGLFLGHSFTVYSAIGVLLAVLGAGFMTFNEAFTISWADAILLLSTLFWVGHILLLNTFTKQYPSFRLAFGQFVACAAFSFIYTQIDSPITIGEIEAAWLPILWGGLLSVSIGYTGQLIGQRKVPPTEASLLMSLEMVFAALIGYLVLGETLTSRELWGVFFISIGVVLAQIPCPWAIPPIVKASK